MTIGWMRHLSQLARLESRRRHRLACKIQKARADRERVLAEPTWNKRFRRVQSSRFGQ